MKLLYNTETGKICATITPQQTVSKLKANYPNSELLEITTDINDTNIFSYQVNLQTLELEKK